VYIPRKNNSKVDALSRRHDITETKEVINTIILKVNNDRLLELARILNLLIQIRVKVLEELQEVII
jgi:hypothetical protein